MSMRRRLDDLGDEKEEEQLTPSYLNRLLRKPLFSPEPPSYRIKVETPSKKDARASEKPIKAALNCTVWVVKRKLVRPSIVPTTRDYGGQERKSVK
jgi:hypothetical protein